MIITFQLAHLRKQIKRGFSWTTFFFGPFALLLRGQYILALIAMVLAVATVGVSWLFFPFIANKLLEETIVQNGWRLVK